MLLRGPCLTFFAESSRDVLGAGGHVLICSCVMDNLHSGGANQRSFADTQGMPQSHCLMTDQFRHLLGAFQAHMTSHRRCYQLHALWM